MSNAVLKELLTEERRRRKERSDKPEKTDKSDKSERGDRKDRSEKPENKGERDKSEKDKRDPKYLAEKEKRRREKEKMEKQRERERTRERSEKRETREVKEVRTEESVEIVQNETNTETTNVQNVQNNQIVENLNEKFMFVYEDGEGILHSDLNKVVLVEGGSIKIFPVYFSGHNDNLYEEVVTYTNGVLTPSEENRENSWLNVIRSSDPDIEILQFDLEDVVVYNNRLFHCKDDLLDYLEAKGYEYLPISK